MGISLYNHQLEAVNKLETGSILCGGVGSGKSRAALAYYFLKEGKGSLKINGKGSYKPMRVKKDLYIITTAKKRDTLEWEEEFIPFLLSKKHVVIDSWNRIKTYVNVKDAFFIFDEQRIVGSGAWVKSFLKIAKKNEWILLTATPGDTWMDYIPVFIANGFYKNRTEFIRNHVVYNRFVKYPKVERYLGTEKLVRLQSKVLITMHYKKSIKSKREYVKVDYDKEKFDRLHVDRWNIFENKPVRDAGQLCYLLRRVVNSDPSRIEATKNLFKKHNKIIIFYNFNYELDLLREMVKEMKIPNAEWNGHKHELIPDTNKWAYLVQYTAGAEGWNCIETNVVLFYSQNYSYKATVQAAGRIDRINTPYDILYYYHLTSNSLIDKAIRGTLNNKKNFNERAFVGNFDSQQKHGL